MAEEAAYTDDERRKPNLKGVFGVDLDWIRAEHSDDAGDTRIEVAFAGGGIVVRDSNKPSIMLRFSIAEFDIFARAVQAGEFDRFLKSTTVQVP
jgi:hypothetical protein